MSDDKKRMVYAIIKFLHEEFTIKQLSAESLEGIEVAIQCLESAYNISINDKHLDTLPPLYEEVELPEVRKEVPPEVKAVAEEFKAEGNRHMNNQNYAEAFKFYSKAINLDNTNAVYFCNRAAALNLMDRPEHAIIDCKKALQIDPSYSKSYGRLGLAYSNLNRHEEACDCYNKALELEPDNPSYKNNLQLSLEKLRANRGGVGVGVGGVSVGVGGMDLSAVLNNPSLLRMASNMLSNPQMQNLMSSLLAANRSGDNRGMETLLDAGQQLAAQLENENPQLVDQIRRQLQESNQQPPQNPPETDDTAKE
uniref:SGTA homodimerisation domain-containing protein n=1 Tax=Clastoptera arizonana TaxID=38151 RepID=A0A1B6EB65_9HEMI